MLVKVIKHVSRLRNTIFLLGFLLGGGFCLVIDGDLMVGLPILGLAVIVTAVAGFRSWLVVSGRSGTIRNAKQALPRLKDWDYEVALLAIGEARDPILVFQTLWFSRESLDLRFWEKIFRGLKEHHPKVLGRVIDRRNSITAIQLRVLAELVHAESIHGPRAAKELQPVIDLATEASLAPWGPISGLEDRFARLFLEEGSGSMLREYLPSVWRSSSETTKRRSLEHLARDRDVPEYQSWRTKYEPITRMDSFRIQAFDGYVFKTGEPAYRKFREKVLESNEEAAKAYNLHLAPLEKKLPEKSNFLHSGWMPPSENPLFLRIRSALEERSPMSFVRVGDGEAYGFDDNPLLFDERGRARQEEHWWGQALDSAVRSGEVADFRLALQQADFLGIPTLGRLVREGFSGYVPNTSSARVIHAAGEALQLAEKVPGQLVLDEWSKFDFMIPDLFLSLVRVARAVVVISGHRPEILEPLFQGASPVTFFELPAHAKQRGSHFASGAGGNIMQVRDEISVALTSGLARPGTLVLVSGGFAGKKLVTQSSASGAVGVDIGQVLIRMANRRARSLK